MACKQSVSMQIQVLLEAKVLTSSQPNIRYQLTQYDIIYIYIIYNIYILYLYRVLERNSWWSWAGIRNRKSSDIVYDVVYDIVYDIFI
jgi:hypothetical protein